MRWQALEHYLHNWYREANISSCRLLLACSGGADSIALALASSRVATALKIELYIAHIHHGPGGASGYRDHALAFTKEFAEKLQIPFICRQASESLNPSEASLREFRRQALEEIQCELSAKGILLAHHGDDLFETRILRLIRGTGLSGLEAMAEVRWPYLRPFLTKGVNELKKYLSCMKQDYLEDPSNQELDPLRNWLRYHWLPQLEERQSGSLVSFRRSLETILDEARSMTFDEGLGDFISKEKGIDRSYLMSLHYDQQLSLVARYLRLCDVTRFTKGQLSEILKRLSQPSNNFQFTMLGHSWQVNAERIQIHLP